METNLPIRKIRWGSCLRSKRLQRPYINEMEGENEIFKAMSKMVDDWVAELISKLTSKNFSGPKRGLWDRFKGGLHNIFYGRDNEENPYYWRNRFGDDLGVSEQPRKRLSLSEYAGLKDAVNKAEQIVDGLLIEDASPVENLKIVKTLRTAAEDLKKRLAVLFSAAPSGPSPSSVPPKRPTRPPEAKPGQRDMDTSPKKDMAPPPADDDGKENTSAPAEVGEKAQEEPEQLKTEPEDKKPQSPATEKKPAEEDPATGNDDKKAKKGSFRAALEEAIELVKSGKRASIVPEDSWLTDRGYLKGSAVPKAMVWLGMKPHVDVSNDEDVKRELSKALAAFKKITTEFKKGSSLLRTMKQNIPTGDFKKKMIELGVDEEKIDALDVADPEPKTVEVSSDDPADAGAVREPRDLLKSLYEGKKETSEIIDEIRKKLIMKIFESAKDYEKKSILEWWKKTKEEKSKLDPEKMIEFINNELINQILNFKISAVRKEEDIMKILSS